MNKIVSFESSLKCNYFKLIRNEVVIFRKELVLKEAPWPELFLKEIEFYEKNHEFEKIINLVPRMLSFDKEKYQIELEYINYESKFTDRYIETLSENVLLEVFKFNDLCNSYKKEISKKDNLKAYYLKLESSKKFSSKALKFLSDQLNEVKELYLCNGDLIPKNILITKKNELKVIDWEFYGYKLKFFDLALLYISIRDRKIKETILNYIRESHEIDSFILSFAIILEKEIRIHLKDDDIKHELEYLYALIDDLEGLIK